MRIVLPCVYCLLLILFFSPWTGAWAKTPVDLELLLAVDVSGSVDPAEAKLQRAGYVSALTSKPVMNAIKSGYLRRIAVAYVEWADSHRQHVVADWTLIDGEKSAYAFAERLDAAPAARGRFTSISAAIDYAMPMFESNAFEGTRRVIDISGDGANNSGAVVIGARDKAIAAGIVINGLPIVNDRPQGFGPQIPNLDLYYRNCVIGGPGAFIVVANDFGSFAVAVRKKMILEIAGLTPPRAPRFIRATERRIIRAAERRYVGMRENRPGMDGKRQAPDCEIGERQLDQRLRNMFFLDN